MRLSFSNLQTHPDTEGSISSDDIFYIIVANNCHLSVACAQEFDLPDYGNIVSRYMFADEKSAAHYAKKLAKGNGYSFEGTIELLD